jgi:transmembrane protein EpsG
MILTNYWWMLIWILGGGVLAIFVPKQQELVNGKKVERWTMPAALILILPYILWAGFRSDNFGDTGAYQRAFRECASSFGKIGNYLSTVTKDKGFYLLMALEKSILGDSYTSYYLLHSIC